MNTNEFRSKFDVDRTSNTPRATPKNAPADYPIALTADGKPFNHSAEYFFYDGEKVRSSSGFRRIDAEHLGNMGLRVIAIKHLHSNRSKAIDAGEAHIVHKIQELKDRIRELEAEKPQKDRTLKYILMSRE